MIECSIPTGLRFEGSRDSIIIPLMIAENKAGFNLVPRPQTVFSQSLPFTNMGQHRRRSNGPCLYHWASFFTVSLRVPDEQGLRRFTRGIQGTHHHKSGLSMLSMTVNEMKMYTFFTFFLHGS